MKNNERITIGKKIMVGYVVILVSVCLLTLVLTGLTLRVTLRQTATRELKNQGEAIVELIGKQGLIRELWQNPVTFKRNIYAIDELTDADIYIVSTGGNVLYRTSESLSPNALKGIREMTTHIYSITSVEGTDGETLGRVILVKDRKSDTVIIRTTLTTILYVITFTGCIGLLIGYLIQRNIVKPLKKMTDEINQIDDIRQVTLTPIKNTDELRTLYQGFMKMLNRLIAGDDERKRFYQNSSHELKTPLMSIQGYAEAIRDGIMEGEEEEALNIIIKKSQELKEIVENLTLLSKVENSEVPYQMANINLEHMVKEWLEHYKGAVAKTGVVIKVEKAYMGEVEAYVDGSQLVKVIEILLDNGLRYAESLINIKVGKSKDDQPVIHVENDGQAISEVDMGRIFERFYTGEGGKSGLGLAIAKSIIEGQGGRIAVENKDKKGVVFSIYLRHNGRH